MKKLQTPLFLIFIGIILCAASCKKEQPDPPPDLPPLTNVGAMTFGCYVNGEPWVAEVPPFQAEFRHLTASYSNSTKRFVLGADKMSSDSPSESISIIVSDLINHDILFKNIKEKYPYKNFDFRCINGLRNNNFEIDTSHKNEIRFTYFDIEKRIASGEFNFSVYAIHCPEEVVHITEGRFDVLFGIVE